MPLSDGVNAVPSSTGPESSTEGVAGVCPVNIDVRTDAASSVRKLQVCVGSTASSWDTTPFTLTVNWVPTASAADGVKVSVRELPESATVPATGVPPWLTIIDHPADLIGSDSVMLGFTDGSSPTAPSAGVRPETAMVPGPFSKTTSTK